MGYRSFGDLRGKWNLIVKAVGKRVLAIVSPKKIDLEIGFEKNHDLFGFSSNAVPPHTRPPTHLTWSLYSEF